MEGFIKSLLIAFVILFSAHLAYACTCSALTIEKEIDETDFVFVGRVIDRQKDESYIPPIIKGASASIQKLINTRERWILTIDVIETFKGGGEGELSMIDYIQDFACDGLHFDIDDEALFFAYKDTETDELTPGGLCSRTRRFDDKSEDILTLRKQFPAKNVSSKNKSNSEQKFLTPFFGNFSLKNYEKERIRAGQDGSCSG